ESGEQRTASSPPAPATQGATHDAASSRAFESLEPRGHGHTSQPEPKGHGHASQPDSFQPDSLEPKGQGHSHQSGSFAAEGSMGDGRVEHTATK
ncbi:hypothetical protein T484DRAFT_1795109, partial [Baffinella frigidus]